MKHIDQPWLWGSLSIAWMAFIYTLSDTPAKDFDVARSTIKWLPFANSLVHIGLFMVLSVFVLRTLVLSRLVSQPLIAYLTIVITSAYGILDEIHQSKIEGRTSETIDVVSDIFGSILIVVFWLLLKKFPSKTQKW
ncbi:MAG: VanZ family protein [Chloroflexota bacterium]|nr:VanZ family protein [Chloroflexota bacterium]MQG37715.1 hypothetical protein [SAR202 cluster bacterium]|tara:strand:- start:662 stop:1069 length:408 start_codon:yes stop_codon:yes gene_type:complete